MSSREPINGDSCYNLSYLVFLLLISIKLSLKLPTCILAPEDRRSDAGDVPDSGEASIYILALFYGCFMSFYALLVLVLDLEARKDFGCALVSILG